MYYQLLHLFHLGNNILKFLKEPINIIYAYIAISLLTF